MAGRQPTVTTNMEKSTEVIVEREHEGLDNGKRQSTSMFRPVIRYSGIPETRYGKMYRILRRPLLPGRYQDMRIIVADHSTEKP
jgi:hypothetical protein